MSTALPGIIFVLVILGLLVFSARARRRQSRVELERAESIHVGSEVMTTSGLYGTVVARNDDNTVLLSIAPGVEVKWAIPALRDLDSLPMEFRGEREPHDEAAEIDLDKPES